MTPTKTGNDPKEDRSPSIQGLIGNVGRLSVMRQADDTATYRYLKCIMFLDATISRTLRYVLELMLKSGAAMDGRGELEELRPERPRLRKTTTFLGLAWPDSHSFYNQSH